MTHQTADMKSEESLRRQIATFHPKYVLRSGWQRTCPSLWQEKAGGARNSSRFIFKAAPRQGEGFQCIRLIIECHFLAVFHISSFFEKLERFLTGFRMAASCSLWCEVNGPGKFRVGPSFLPVRAGAAFRSVRCPIVPPKAAANGTLPHLDGIELLCCHFFRFTFVLVLLVFHEAVPERPMLVAIPYITPLQGVVECHVGQFRVVVFQLLSRMQLHVKCRVRGTWIQVQHGSQQNTPWLHRSRCISCHRRPRLSSGTLGTRQNVDTRVFAV